MSYAIKKVHLGDVRYPAPLRGIRNPPLVLYFRGTLPRKWGLSVAVVGSRNASADALRLTARVVQQLRRSPKTIIVSGLAIGIDTAAHRAALRCALRTVAVVGNGLASVYPVCNRDLAERIVTAGGCIISELRPEAPASPRNLIARDRIQAALSQAVLLIQSDTSGGAMHTAAFALEQDKNVYAALPRSRSRKWSGNRLLLSKRLSRPLTSTSLRRLWETTSAT